MLPTFLYSTVPTTKLDKSSVSGSDKEKEGRKTAELRPSGCKGKGESMPCPAALQWGETRSGFCSGSPPTSNPLSFRVFGRTVIPRVEKGQA